MKITKGSGNVFADLGLPDAEEMLIKSQLVITINQLIVARGLTQSQASKIVGLSQPKLSNILRGRFRGVSGYKLMECLTRLGCDIDIVVRTKRSNARLGHLKVVFA